MRLPLPWWALLLAACQPAMRQARGDSRAAAWRGVMLAAYHRNGVTPHVRRNRAGQCVGSAGAIL